MNRPKASKPKSVTIKLTADQHILAMSAVAYMQDLCAENRELYHALNGVGEVLADKTDKTWKQLKNAIHNQLAEKGENNDKQDT